MRKKNILISAVILIVIMIVALVAFFFIIRFNQGLQDIHSNSPISYSNQEDLTSYTKDISNCDPIRYHNQNYPKFGFLYSKCDWKVFEQDRSIGQSPQHFVELSYRLDPDFKLMFILYPWYPDGGFSFIQGSKDYVVLSNTKLVRTPKILEWGKIGESFDFEYNKLNYEGSSLFETQCFSGDKYCGGDAALSFKTEYIHSSEETNGFFHIVINSNSNLKILSSADKVVDTLTY